MSLLFMDGFEQFKDLAPADVAAEISSAGYTVSGILPTEGRTADTICLAIGDASAGSVSRTFSSGSSRVVLQFAYKAETAREDIVAITNGFTLSWPDKLEINGSKGGVTPIIGLWYYYELIVDKAAGTITVFINNVQDLTVPMPSAMEFLTTWEVTWSAPAASPKLLDDLFFIDGTGGGIVNRTGPQKIVARMPSADVVKEWSPSDGDDHYAMVNQRPPVEGAFIQSAVSGATDLFRSGDAVSPGAITAVSVVVRVRKSDIDERQVGILIGQGVGQKETLIPTLAITPEYKYAVFPSAPGDVPWTESLLLDTPFGVRVRP